MARRSVVVSVVCTRVGKKDLAMKILSVSTIAAAVLAIGAGMVAMPSVQAQGLEWAGGRSPASGTTCAPIEWHIIPVATGGAVALNGVAYFSDMSGISTIKGGITAEGAVSAMLVSVSGNGPAGAVTGMRSAAGTHVEMNGAGCSKAKFDLMQLTATPMRMGR